MFVLGITIGLLLGSLVGVFVCALCIAGGDDSWKE